VIILEGKKSLSLRAERAKEEKRRDSVNTQNYPHWNPGRSAENNVNTSSQGKATGPDKHQHFFLSQEGKTTGQGEIIGHKTEKVRRGRLHIETGENSRKIARRRREQTLKVSAD